MTLGETAGQHDPAIIETPVGYVDLDRVVANAQRVAAYATEHGLGWRPHIKTHKSKAVAKIQLDAGARGLTVATSTASSPRRGWLGDTNRGAA